MIGFDWLGKQVRVFAAYDRRKEHAPMAVGEVVYYCDGPVIGVRGADGHIQAWPVSLPIEHIEGDDKVRQMTRAEVSAELLARMEEPRKRGRRERGVMAIPAGTRDRTESAVRKIEDRDLRYAMRRLVEAAYADGYDDGHLAGNREAEADQ